MAILVTKETQAVVAGLGYQSFTAGMVYDANTRPPTTPELETQAVSEGWAQQVLLPAADQPPPTSGIAEEPPTKARGRRAPPFSPNKE